MVKKCLKCNKNFEAKKETAKYCSVSCRVMFNRKVDKNEKVEKEKSLLMQTQVLLNSVVEMVGKINYGVVPTSFDGKKNDYIKMDEIGQWQEPKKYLPTFQDLLNGMDKVSFSDEKEEYALKIMDATHLSEKQIKLLLSNLWAKN
jgi:hypothetical protein